MAQPQEKKILVVDDEEDVSFFLSTALQDAGFRTETASGVDEALERLQASPPDCVSLDMVMPGKSGIVLFHEMRRNERWRKIPVLFVTGHAKEEGVKKALDAAASLADSTLSGPATYLDKPVTAEKFVKAIADILHVELGPEERVAPSSEEEMRAEAKRLLESAGSEALREALKLLKSKGS
jgi:CheY-like chemotaxis protein